ncbi:metal dependent phosphohydrolase [Methanosalsum zhilinae DSM 4017]|uniref:Metal dependent phosphohydrolase n=1 Tax=Methanosalsum zhilinae (strain DSM 4017 / NBRC 107636 / OCM 62 / WeN5) TaxID=679901 RepID=F7XMD5_METZD|nr:HD domain-containing protein [Methanosalsum zhilinae]AEH61674.1 metal dependent phosphohydrolase [Methanosalsum zhilinae DSM 4017]
MKVIRDPVHGYIEMDTMGLGLCDTKRMQRLRRVRQLGTSNLVYPGANHTRFEHSLGTMHLAGMLTNQIEEPGTDEKDELRAAALLHDIGHGPLSHVSEGIIKHYTRQKHDDVKHILKKEEIRDVLEDFGLNPSRLAKHIKGETSIGQILCSEIDVDRMDYLIRDAHYTGVTFGLVDHIRLIHEMDFYENRLVVRMGGLKAAESLLVSRFLMHPSVYFHHVSRIAETMCSKAIRYLIENKTIDPFSFRKMDDSQLFEAMRNDTGYAGDIARRLEDRRLYKRALYTGFESVSENVLKLQSSTDRIETEIAELAGIEPEKVLVDIPETPEITEMKAMVRTGDQIIRIDEASHVVSILEKAHLDNWRMGVYTPQEYREKVAKVAREFFDVKKNTKQFRLTEL